MRDCDLTMRRNVHRSCNANAQKMLTSMAIAADTRYGILARSVSAQRRPRLTKAPLRPTVAKRTSSAFQCASHVRTRAPSAARRLVVIRHDRLVIQPWALEVPRALLGVPVKQQQVRVLFRGDREKRVVVRGRIALAIRGRRNAKGWHGFRDLPKHLAGAISSSVLEY